MFNGVVGGSATRESQVTGYYCHLLAPDQINYYFNPASQAKRA